MRTQVRDKLIASQASVVNQYKNIRSKL